MDDKNFSQKNLQEYLKNLRLNRQDKQKPLK